MANNPNGIGSILGACSERLRITRAFNYTCTHKYTRSAQDTRRSLFKSSTSGLKTAVKIELLISLLVTVGPAVSHSSSLASFCFFSGDADRHMISLSAITDYHFLEVLVFVDIMPQKNYKSAGKDGVNGQSIVLICSLEKGGNIIHCFS